jgi:hypothetical protein
MASFADYAALVRQLHEQQRAGEDSAARATQHRTALTAALDQLGQRLAIQQQRLAQLAQATGHMPPPPVPQQTGAGWPTPPPPVGPPVPGPPVQGTLPPGQPTAGEAGSGAYPGRMDHGGAATGGATRMLPAVPGPRAGEPAAAPAAPDPVRELELARQRADEADAAASRAETIAQHPPLLPNVSPLVRAITVYLGCSAVAALIQLVPVLATDDTPSGTFTLFAWVCAGLPAMAFFAGYFVLSTWGKPKIVLGRAEAYARIGFAICFVAMPLAYCGWYTIMRTLVSS